MTKDTAKSDPTAELFGLTSDHTAVLVEALDEVTNGKFSEFVKENPISLAPSNIEAYYVNENGKKVDLKDMPTCLDLLRQVYGPDSSAPVLYNEMVLPVKDQRHANGAPFKLKPVGAALNGFHQR